jgi:integrase
MNPNQPPTSSPPEVPIRGQGKKLLDQACTELVERVSDQLRIKHYSLRQELLGHKDVKTIMIYTHAEGPERCKSR